MVSGVAQGSFVVAEPLKRPRGSWPMTYSQWMICGCRRKTAILGAWTCVMEDMTRGSTVSTGPIRQGGAHHEDFHQACIDDEWGAKELCCGERTS